MSFEKRVNKTEQQKPKRREKFLRSISFKAANIIKSSLPARSSPVAERTSGFLPEKDEANQDKSSSSQSPHKDIATSLTETASSVLNRINPFESPSHSFDKQDKPNLIYSQLEKHFGLTSSSERSQSSEAELTKSNGAVFNYANDMDSEMLEVNQTPEPERSKLISSTGNSEHFDIYQG